MAWVPAVGAALEFRHVDVFTDVPFAGNGLIVLFGSTSGLQAESLISVTAEMRQFELIVAEFQPEAGRVPARIFTADEELPFAGHPVIGAAAALHERYAAGEPERSWVFVIAGREILVRSRQTARYYEAEMNQGAPVDRARIMVGDFEERLASVGQSLSTFSTLSHVRGAAGTTRGRSRTSPPEAPRARWPPSWPRTDSPLRTKRSSSTRAASSGGRVRSR